MAFTTSGQETEWALFFQPYSYSPEAHAGPAFKLPRYIFRMSRSQCVCQGHWVNVKVTAAIKCVSVDCSQCLSSTERLHSLLTQQWCETVQGCSDKHELY